MSARSSDLSAPSSSGGAINAEQQLYASLLAEWKQHPETIAVTSDQILSVLEAKLRSSADVLPDFLYTLAACQARSPDDRVGALVRYLQDWSERGKGPSAPERLDQSPPTVPSAQEAPERNELQAGTVISKIEGTLRNLNRGNKEWDRFELYTRWNPWNPKPQDSWYRTSHVLHYLDGHALRIREQAAKEETSRFEKRVNDARSKVCEDVEFILATALRVVSSDEDVQSTVIRLSKDIDFLINLSDREYLRPSIEYALQKISNVSSERRQEIAENMSGSLEEGSGTATQAKALEALGAMSQLATGGSETVRELRRAHMLL